MTTGKLSVNALLLFVTAWLFGCSSEKGQSGSQSVSPEDDRREIEATLEETATRWRYGDKVILYEQEFECLQVEHTFDEYLEKSEIKMMQSDTVATFAVRNVRFFDRDSAQVSVDVVFVGPAGDTTLYPQEWTMYYHCGHWIRPTLSSPGDQLRFEERRRKADSAARAEENEVW
jgi:hypothetical protein